MVYRRTTLVQLRQTEREMHKFAIVKKFGEKKISLHSFGFMSMLRVTLHRFTTIIDFR
jgi:hypothetical protein